MYIFVEIEAINLFGELKKGGFVKICEYVWDCAQRYEKL